MQYLLPLRTLREVPQQPSCKTQMILQSCRYVTLPAVLSTLVLLSACDAADPEDQSPQLPDFVLSDLSGNNFRLSDERGNVVLLHFFAHNCAACRFEAPTLNIINAKYREQDFKLLAVAVGWNSVDDVEAFATEYVVGYTILLDDDTVSSAYGLTVVPKTYFLTKSGHLDSWAEGVLTKGEIETVVEELLKE